MTVKFVLNRPEAPFIANMAMDFASIVSKEYADKLQADGKMADAQPTRRSAPARSSSSPTRRTRSSASRPTPDYWDGKQPIDDLVFAITTDTSVRMQKLKAGECHVAPYPNPADLEGLKADPNLQVMEQEGLNVGYLAYNTQQTPFDNVEVRKALNMAINKQAIIDAVFQGAGTAGQEPDPADHVVVQRRRRSTIRTIRKPPRRCSTEAGVSGLKMKVWAMPVARPYNPNARRMAELIQADFAKVGVEVEIVSYEWGEYLKISQAT